MKNERGGKKTEADTQSKAPEITMPKQPGGGVVWLMVGLSGFACLVYQILWMRQLGLLFGNTSYATALTLGIFFAGLAAGGWFWGKKSSQLTNPFRTYAWLEAGIAICGLSILFAPGVIRYFYPIIYQRHGQGFALMVFKLLWTWLMVFPPALLMGGTLPVIGQAIIRQISRFGTTTARLYAVNTLGAAFGAFATAFVFIASIGIRMTCLAAMLASLLAGIMAFLLSSKDTLYLEQTVEYPPKQKAKTTSVDAPEMPRMVIRSLAFLSGFNLLALEVIWTRMLAQVHENSVYSFSAILIVVLVCLSLGAGIASWLIKGKTSVSQSLIMMIVLGGAMLSFSTYGFTKITNGMEMLSSNHTFVMYVVRLFFTTFVAIGPACLLLGAVFPLLMKCEEHFTSGAGNSIGQLSAINTIGAIFGSLAAGFLMLGRLGLWDSIRWIAIAYLVVALILPFTKSKAGYAFKAIACMVLLLNFTWLLPSKLPQVWSKDDFGKKEKLLDKWEGSDCTVTVVENSQGDIAIKINSNYGLGSILAITPQQFQARIPLLAFPKTESVFFLGMGTGITAGEALMQNTYPGIKKVVACELSPGVVAASKKYFAGGTGEIDLTNGLFTDARARVLTEDGRNHLIATADQYAMINADLFLPYRRGTGNLYSREHYQNSLMKLKPDGVYVQWLPLYQITEREFGIISKTMLSVFPQVSLWRGNFQAGAEIAALVGHADTSPLPASSLNSEHQIRMAVAGKTHKDIQQLSLPINQQTILFFYGGNMTLSAELFEKYPLNTDDLPVIEFGTPHSMYRPELNGKPQFLQDRFADMVEQIQNRTPPENDPLLIHRNIADRKLPLAGSAFHRANIASVSNDEEAWKMYWKLFLTLWSD